MIEIGVGMSGHLINGVALMIKSEKRELTPELEAIAVDFGFNTGRDAQF